MSRLFLKLLPEIRAKNSMYNMPILKEYLILNVPY